MRECSAGLQGLSLARLPAESQERKTRLIQAFAGRLHRGIGESPPTYGLDGEEPLDEVLAALDATEPNDDQAKRFAGGMGNLVGVLGSVLSGPGEEKHESAV